MATVRNGIEPGKQKAQPSVDVSVILIAHHEGLLAHPTVRSAERAAMFARKHDTSVEIIAVLDNPDTATQRYFESQQDLFSAICHVDYRDPGLSRNHGVRQARGKYVCFLDADDLFGENWIQSAFAMAEGNSGEVAVYHPQVNLGFGNIWSIFLHRSMAPRERRALDLLKSNQWSALSFVSREFFLDGNQYAPTAVARGFGAEDWHWNCQTLAHGAAHRVVPQTVHFIRSKACGSRDAEGRAAHVVIPPSDLFSDEVMAEIQDSSLSRCEDETPCQDKADVVYGKVRRTQRIARWGRSVLQCLSLANHPEWQATLLKLLNRTPRFRQFCFSMGDAFLDVVHGIGHLVQTNCRPDEWLMDEWDRIAALEPELMQARATKTQFRARMATPPAIGPKYPDLSRAYGIAPQFVILLPDSLEHDAFRQATELISGIVEFRGNDSVVAVTAGSGNCDWRSCLPERLPVLNLKDSLPNQLNEERQFLLCKLLVQKPPDVVINFGSQLGQHLFEMHAAALASQSRLFTVVLEREIGVHGHLAPSSAAIPSYFECLAGLAVPNEKQRESIIVQYGIDREKITTIGRLLLEFVSGAGSLNGCSPFDSEARSIRAVHPPGKQLQAYSNFDHMTHTPSHLTTQS